jgi:hypothetical protein
LQVPPEGQNALKDPPETRQSCRQCFGCLRRQRLKAKSNVCVGQGYIDKGGVFTSFDPLGLASTTINGVNDLGDIVGFYTNSIDAVIGFVGTPVPEPST